MTVSGSRIKRTRAQLAIAAVLVVSACAPVAHRNGVVGGETLDLIRLGDVARESGDPAVALPLYQRAQRLEPFKLLPITRIAETYHQLGAYYAAGDAWNSVLLLDDVNFDAMIGYGNTLTALRQPIAALEYFNKAHDIGETPDLLNGIGVAHDMLGHAMQAQDAYRAGLDLAPNSIRLSNNLGLSLALSGHFTEAIATLEAAVKMGDAGVRQRQNLALAYGVAGFPERAQAVVRRDMDDVLAQRNLAFYRLVAGLEDHAAKVAAVGARTSGGLTTDGMVAQNAKVGR